MFCLTDDIIKEVVDILKNPGTFTKSTELITEFRDGCSYYTNNNSTCVSLNLSDGTGALMHRYSTPLDGVQFSFLLIDKEYSLLCDDYESLNDLYLDSKMYFSEEEHFMDSTVENLSIPYIIMEEFNTFCRNYANA